VVGLSDLGGGAPNADLTWALFDERVDDDAEDGVVPRPAAEDEGVDGPAGQPASLVVECAGRRGA
jgi:hypothetical protein